MEELVNSAKASSNTLRVGVSFFDVEIEARILQALQQPHMGHGQRFLIEAPVLLESIRPFLDTLKTVVPSDIPFAKYLVHPESGRLDNVKVEPPLYATTPGYTFTLDCLFTDGRTNLILDPSSERSKTAALDRLKLGSRLDPTQAEATVKALTSGVALIQGPPGTGKSYTGVELLRVLIQNNIGPILLIAFTNHALDHLLQNVLDAGITTRIIRIGSRSSEEKIAALSLEKILSERTRSGMRRAIAREFRTLKEVEESLVELMQKVFSRKIDSSSLQRYLDIQYPNHLEEIMEPPLWIRRLYEDHMEWNTAASGPKNGKIKDQFDYWLAAKDVEFVEAAIRQNTPQHQQSNSTMTISQLTNRFASFGMNENSLEESDADPLQGRIGEAPLHEDPKSAAESPLSFFKRLGLPGLPPIPVGRRGAEELQDDFMVWSMSRTERQALYSAWRDIIKQTDHEIQIQEFKKLREKHENTRKIIEAADNQDKVQVLRQAHIIGCTTNGAAKLTSLLKSVCPKVLLVEEAGQVLEAHILSSLVPSIQHMILIGDPQQLRPTLANYLADLSADHPRGGEVYRFDQSLMERLWKMGFPMSKLDVQRRMRPAVSNLIRQTLYNTLVDHESVQSYPPVRGMAHNVFFLDHRHAEDGGGDESASKTNKYEVAMIKDLVLHFLRQGKYSGDRDIIVLCAYLGQLSLIRKELSKE
ncbi:hypothetical protein FRC03_002079, partial [Tulasnella sp. 419]